MKRYQKIFNAKEINYDYTSRGVHNKPTTEKGLVLERLFKKGDCFTKIGKVPVVKDYIKEAKRVQYIIEQDDMGFYINDDQSGDLVMSGIMVNHGLYAISFSKNYWQEPPYEVTASDLEEKRIDLSTLNS
jgi:hypothetical protein